MDDLSNPADLSPEEIDDLCRDVGRHLVSLAFVQEFADREAKLVFCSGFLMQIDGRWYFITAGHILEEIKAAGSAVSQFRLIDVFGHGESKHPIPFVLDDAWMTYENSPKDGLDFGAIELSEYYKKLLQANGAEALSLEAAQSSSHVGFNRYLLLGLGKEDVNRETVYKQEHYVLRGVPVPTLMMLSQVYPIPKNFDTRYPTLVAEISPRAKISTIEGMSGGPIFGVDMDTAHMEIVAIQIAWDGDRRIVGCPLSVAAPILKELIERRDVDRG